MAAIHIADIEAAIDLRRDRKPSPGGVTDAPAVRALAEGCTPPIVHAVGQPVRRVGP